GQKRCPETDKCDGDKATRTPHRLPPSYLFPPHLWRPKTPRDAPKPRGTPPVDAPVDAPGDAPGDAHGDAPRRRPSARAGTRPKCAKRDARCGPRQVGGERSRPRGGMARNETRPEFPACRIAKERGRVERGPREITWRANRLYAGGNAARAKSPLNPR